MSAAPLEPGAGAKALLSIDFDAERRTLAGAALRGDWELPAALVRGAVRAGARSVTVHLAGGGVTVAHDGREEPDRLRRLALLLDEDVPAPERHRALLALERAGATELLALGSLPAAAVSVESGELRLSSRSGRPRIEAIAGGPRHLVAVRLRLPPAPTRRHLAEACRFAGPVVVVDGRPLPRGFGDPLLEVGLPSPLRGRLALPRRAGPARVSLLLDGVEAGRVSLPEGPCFEAALELGGVAEPASSSAGLREALAPHLEALQDAALGAWLGLARRTSSLAPTEAALLRRQILEAARRKHRTTEVLRAAVFPVLTGPRGDLWHADLVALGRGASGGVLPALHPGDRPEEFVLPEGMVAILDATERATVSCLTGLRLAPLPRREACRGWRPLLRRALRRLDGWLGAVSATALPWARLTSAERALLTALRAGMPGPAGGTRVEPILCSGGGRVRHLGGRRPRLRLPRRNPAVVAAARAVARDPAWAYPALLALLGGASGRVPGREAWLAAAGVAGQPRRGDCRLGPGSIPGRSRGSGAGSPAESESGSTPAQQGSA